MCARPQTRWERPGGRSRQDRVQGPSTGSGGATGPVSYPVEPYPADGHGLRLSDTSGANRPHTRGVQREGLGAGYF